MHVSNVECVYAHAPKQKETIGLYCTGKKNDEGEIFESKNTFCLFVGIVVVVVVTKNFALVKLVRG